MVGLGWSSIVVRVDCSLHRINLRGLQSGLRSLLFARRFGLCRVGFETHHRHETTNVLLRHGEFAGLGGTFIPQ